MITISFVLGFIVSLFFAVFVSGKIVKRKAEKYEYASAYYDAEKKEWRVTGKFAGIAQQLVDIRSGRTSYKTIKYID